MKTLKDIELEGSYPAIAIADLEQEAIKWIKESEGKTFFCTVCEKFDCSCSSSDAFKIHNLKEIAKWIEYSFNITEDFWG